MILKSMGTNPYTDGFSVMDYTFKFSHDAICYSVACLFCLKQFYCQFNSDEKKKTKMKIVLKQFWE